MSEPNELPRINWRAEVAPGMDRREQLLRYTDTMGREAAKRQVRLRREELARLRPPKPKPK